MRKTFALATLLLLAALAFSYCPTAVRQINVPAVVTGQEGGLLRVVVSVAPGNGSIYTEISPIVGASTQQSQAKAVEQAFASAGIKQSGCDVHFSFADMGQSPAVDGPSAGVAMAVALKAALQNATIRDDVAVTGAILDGGQVGPVGGIIDKAQAASRMGMRVLVTPQHEIYENILLSKLEEQYSFVDVDAKTLEQAYNIATSAPNASYSPNFELGNISIPEGLQSRQMNWDDERFAKVASAINSALLQNIGFSSPALAKYKDHFEQLAAQNEKIIGMGYGYTAANNAFLAQVDAAFLTTPPHEIDLQAQVDSAKKCVQQMPDVSITRENVEWVSGANARKNWALEKIGDIENNTQEYDSQESQYLALREIYYAHSWCLAGTQMLIQAQDIGGTPINASALAPYAQEGVNGAAGLISKSLVQNPDALWHLGVANKSLQKGDYAGAIFDSAYVIGVQSASNVENEAQDGEVEKEVQMLSAQNYSTLWARTYQSQGVYTLAQDMEDGAPVSDSHNVLSLAQSMENAFGGIGQKLANPPETYEVSLAKKPENSLLSDLFAVVIWGGLALLVAKVAFMAVKNRYKILDS
ncbi:MAG: S16 family serine protease [Candidatus Micrarchaeota archaeon]